MLRGAGALGVGVASVRRAATVGKTGCSLLAVPKIMSSRDNTFEQRMGKWALRQFVLIPLLVLIAGGIIVILVHR